MVLSAGADDTMLARSAASAAVTLMMLPLGAGSGSQPTVGVPPPTLVVVAELCVVLVALLAPPAPLLVPSVSSPHAANASGITMSHRCMPRWYRVIPGSSSLSACGVPAGSRRRCGGRARSAQGGGAR